MAYRDLLPGGLADKRRPSDFNQKELRRGIKVELEHTDDPEIAREIAMDHLTEDRAYYEKLAMIEKNPRRPPKAWFDRCVRGVKAGGSAYDPQAVCGAQWQKMSDSQRRRAMRESESYMANEIGGAGTALIIGGIALVGYLLFAKKSAAKPAVANTACTIDVQKLDRWGQARGFTVIYFALAKEPPTPEEFFTGVNAPVLDVGEQAIAVLADGSFWYYTQSEISPGVPLTGRADNLRADYCAFTG